MDRDEARVEQAVALFSRASISGPVTRNGRFSWSLLPPEVQERVFEQSLVNANLDADSWHWTTDANGELDMALDLLCMRPPAMMRVDRQTRKHFLAWLYRKTTFRVNMTTDPCVPKPYDLDEVTRCWLKSLDRKGEVAIRKLEVRLLFPDSSQTCATMRFRYLMDQKTWEVELVRDVDVWREEEKSEDELRQEAADKLHLSAFFDGQIRPYSGPKHIHRPSDMGIELIENSLAYCTRTWEGSMQGLSWAGVVDMLSVIHNLFHHECLHGKANPDDPRVWGFIYRDIAMRRIDLRRSLPFIRQ